MEYILSVQDISKTFNHTHKVLDQVSLNIKKGEIVFLVGANGAGKTTLVQIILGLLESDGGEIIFQNKKIRQPYPAEIKRDFGYLPDEPLFIEYLSALENLQYYCALYNQKISDKDLEKLLETYGLGGTGKKLVKYFSKGMKQKLNLCYMEIINPKLIIMDEPTVGLDIVSMENLKSHILQFAKQGHSLLITSHDMAFCHSIADEIYILNQGRTAKLPKNKLLNEQDLSSAIMSEINNFE